MFQSFVILKIPDYACSVPTLVHSADFVVFLFSNHAKQLFKKVVDIFNNYKLPVSNFSALVLSSESETVTIGNIQ